MVTCTRKLEFCAGHRVRGHESKCANVHGHQYTVHIEVMQTSCGVDGIGRVVDFGVVKTAILPWIDSNWDHALILHRDDDRGPDVELRGGGVVRERNRRHHGG